MAELQATVDKLHAEAVSRERELSDRDNNLVNMLGRAVAAEVILLMVARCCTAQEVKNLGCPTVNKTWTATRELQNRYNQHVRQLQSIPESAVLSDSPQPKPDDDDDAGCRAALVAVVVVAVVVSGRGRSSRRGC